jgi:hypothetical protein
MLKFGSAKGFGGLAPIATERAAPVPADGVKCCQNISPNHQQRAGCRAGRFFFYIGAGHRAGCGLMLPPPGGALSSSRRRSKAEALSLFCLTVRSQP